MRRPSVSKAFDAGFTMYHNCGRPRPSDPQASRKDKYMKQYADPITEITVITTDELCERIAQPALLRLTKAGV